MRRGARARLGARVLREGRRQPDSAEKASLGGSGVNGDPTLLTASSRVAGGDGGYGSLVKVLRSSVCFKGRAEQLCGIAR